MSEDKMPDKIYAHIYGDPRKGFNDYRGAVWGSGEKYIDKHIGIGEHGSLYYSQAHIDALNARHEERVKELKQEIGLIEIQLGHKTTLLESCENALEERDIKHEAQMKAQREEIFEKMDVAIGNFGGSEREALDFALGTLCKILDGLNAQPEQEGGE